MKLITEGMVVHVAGLAKLHVTEQDIPKYKFHLEKILEHMEDLKNVDTEGLLPLTNPMRENMEFFFQGENLREDEISPSLGTSEVLKNAPDFHRDQFRVDAMIEDV